MGRSRLGWACTAIAPWCLALGLVVSITAQAGQDPTFGGSVSFESAQSPIRQALLASAYHPSDDLIDRGAGGPQLIEASLTLGSPEDLAAGDDEGDPRADLKRARPPFPVVNRSRKGDPFVGLRPGFEAKLNRRPGGKDAVAPGESRPSFVDPFGSVESALAYAELPPDEETAPWSDPDAAPETLPPRGDLFRGAQRAGRRTGRGRTSRAQSGSQRPLSRQRLRRRLSGPQPSLRLPILLRLRRKVAARRGARPVERRVAHRPGRDGRQNLQPESRRGAELSRQLRHAVLGEHAQARRPDRASYLLSIAHQSELTTNASLSALRRWRGSAPLDRPA